jgi:short-chain fatty acids transporter
MTNASTASAVPVFERIGARVAGNVQKWLPDPFLFAILLTFIAFAMGMIFAGKSAEQMVTNWYRGFWNLHTFAMQMVLILVTGYVLAHAPFIRQALNWLADQPRTGTQGIVLVTVLAMVVSWINWGFGLIVGAIMAVEVGKRAHTKGIPVHYPVLCTAGYAGLGVSWHWGLSGSAPLLSNTKGHVFEKLIGIVPTSDTIFSGYAIWLTVLSLIYVPLILYLITPKTADRCRGIEHWLPEAVKGGAGRDAAAAPRGDASWADRINNSVILGGLTVVMGLVYILMHFQVGRWYERLDLNIVIFIFLIVGLALYLRPYQYLLAFYEAVKASAGVILQFPFYAGIMGMIGLSGLGVIMAGWLISIANPTTYPMMAWLAAGFVNLFVPSGGGEWAVLGETLLRAGQNLGVPAGKTIIAFATGDAWTNLFQPFWAIALLGLTGMRARDMFGYCIVLMFALLPFFAILLTWLPY